MRSIVYVLHGAGGQLGVHDGLWLWYGPGDCGPKKGTIVFYHEEETAKKNSLGSRARKISRGRDSPLVLQDLGPPLQVRDQDSQQPCWDMHVMQVFNYKMMIEALERSTRAMVTAWGSAL